MQLNPYVHFDGRCEEAFKFYQQTFGGKIEMLLRNEDAPADAGMPSPPERKQKIMHAKMSIDGQVLMASDAPPGRQSCRCCRCSDTCRSSFSPRPFPRRCAPPPSRSG